MPVLISLRIGKISRLIGVLTLLSATLGAPAASAQITAATIAGVVTDETGGVLPGVEVTVKNLATGLERSAVAATAGSYTISGLPPGVYDARATLSGFTTAVQSGIQLTVAQQANLNLTMKVGRSELVVVVARIALVETKSSSLSGVVDEETIEDLPLNGRNFLDLALLQPGVAAFKALPGRGQQLNINGAGGRSNSYLLDGANMKSVAGRGLSNAADTTLGLDMIREFRVVTNAFSADYGRAMGGVILVVTKSGTNGFRGSAFEFFRNSTLDARNFFDTDKPPFERHQFGFTMGGPIRKDKTFFFGGAEWLVERLGLTQVTTVPTMAARSGELWPINPIVQPYLDLFPLPNGQELGGGLARFTFPFNRPTDDTFVQMRVDHNFSSASSLFVRYAIDAAAQRLPGSFPQFTSDGKSRNQWLTIEAKRVFGSALLNTARFSYSRLKLGDHLVAEGVGPDLAFVPGQPTIGNIQIGGIGLIGPNQTAPQTGDIDYFTFSDDVGYSKGRHFIKTGALIERVHTDRDTSGRLRGRYNFPSLQRFLAGTPSLFSGIFPGADIERSRRNMVFGFYVQDDVTAHARLTLNLGLRYEFYTVPTDIKGRDSALRNVATDREYTVGPPFENPSLKNAGPRIGVAWDISGDGRTAVRAGAGIYYDTDGPFNTPLNIASFSPPFAIPVSVADPTFPRPPFEGSGTRAGRGVDYHVRQPRLLTGNLNVQREVVSNLVLMVGYAGSRGSNLVQAIEGNPVVPEILPDGTKFFRPNTPRRNPNWESIDFRTTGGRSWYDALQLSATRRFSRGHRWEVSYTFGKTIDETQGQTASDAANSSSFPQDPIDPQNDRGPADYDVRHVLTMNFTWELPFGQQLTGLAGALARGWQISGLGTLRSGVPFSPSISSNWSRSGNVAVGAEDRPSLRPGVRLEDIILGGPTQYFDRDAFVLQARGFVGNAGRNMLTGPGFANFDLSLAKNHTSRLLGPRGQIEVRVEVFNVFNRTNFSIPDRVVFGGAREGEAPLTTAGQITSTVTDARQAQLGVKFRF
jgi:carboxypeptidase family protein/TonB-dependent receptor-like protein